MAAASSRTVCCPLFVLCFKATARLRPLISFPANAPLIGRHAMIRLICPLLICLSVLGNLADPGIAAEGLNLSGLALTPNSRVVPGQVMILMARMENYAGERAAGTVVVSIEELPSLQSARYVMVEPGQSEQFELFIPLPQELAQFERLNLVATVYVRDGDREVILQRDGAPVVNTLRLPVTQGRVYGMAMEPEAPQYPNWYWPTNPPHRSYELATAARVDAGGTRISATFEMQSLPLNQVQWNGLDLFVIADPAPLRDPAAVQSMCEFIARGGKLWVMLDKVPTALVRPLLGISQMCEEVERVELNDFTIEIESYITQLSEKDRSISSDRDVPMTRIVQSGGRVTHHVDGWPVALSMDIGYGQLLLTTLDSFVWIQPRNEQRSADPYVQSNYQTQTWGTNFAVSTNEPRVDLPLSKIVEYPLRLIGNPVVPKRWVAIGLMGFCGVLAVLGSWLAYSGRLPVIGVVAPGVAVVASLALLLAASWVRRDIPESVSRLQVVDIGDNGSFALVREQSSVYLSQAANMKLESSVDGVMHSSEAVTSGVRLLVNEDFQKWHVANENWPPGAWRYEAEFVVPTQQLIATGRLSEQGLELNLPSGLPSELEDPVLSYVTGDPLLCEASEGGLRVNDQVTLDGVNWISGSLISDEQQRRLEIYQQFFEPNKFLHRPAARLYGWTAPWSAATWNRELKQQGSALVALPVALERPAIGQQIFVPHGLIQLRRLTSQANLTSTFDDYTGKWRDEVGMASQVDMEFVLPTEVVPLTVQAIEFELDITAPQRTVTVSFATASGPVEIVKLDGPSIPWKQTITHPDILQAFQDGRLPVSLNISDLNSAQGAMGATSIVTWHIDHMHAAVRGQMLPLSSLSESP